MKTRLYLILLATLGLAVWAMAGGGLGPNPTTLGWANLYPTGTATSGAIPVANSITGTVQWSRPVFVVYRGQSSMTVTSGSTYYPANFIAANLIRNISGAGATNGVITVPEDGDYDVIGQGLFNIPAPGPADPSDFYAAILTNGALWVRTIQTARYADPSPSVHGKDWFPANTTFQLVFRQGSGTNQPMSTAETDVFFMLRKEH